jgi:uncharacterized protein
MWDLFHATALLEGVGTAAAWLVTGCLLLAGAVGCILPMLPGHLILLLAAISHRLMLGAESGLNGWSFVMLILLMAISQTFELLSGAAGAKWFGGTRWGALGALVGSVVGVFFLPFGLLLGPLVGAFACELAFAKKASRAAAASGVGSVVGTVAGLVIKGVVGVLMIGWFFLDVFAIG